MNLPPSCNVFLSCLCLVLPCFLWGQPGDSLEQHYTVKIRKAPLVVEFSEAVPTNLPVLAETPRTAVQAPRLTGGNYGFLRIEPYYPTLPLNEERSYVVFNFSINAQGRVAQIEIKACNDRRLKGILVQELEQSHWQPALDAQGRAVDFRFSEQLFQLSGKSYAEDYDRY